MIIFLLAVAAMLGLVPIELRIRRRKQPFNYRAYTAVVGLLTSIMIVGLLVGNDRPPGFIAVFAFAVTWLFCVSFIFVITRATSKSYERRDHKATNGAIGKD